jgi:pimeloyl-ACP methyl ester carboxylesterase
MIVGLVVLLAITGASYQAVETRADARRFPQQGESVDIGGYKLNLNCTGEGSPTVVLEGGLASPSFTWSRVQPGIASFTRVCSYDRAGYMWSDYSPLPRTSVQIARELHMLLQNAGEKPPYVMVGHSFGGLDIRVYNGLYPNEVAGMVLPESTHPDLLDRLPPGIKRMSDNAQKQRERQDRIAPLLYWLGIARFRSRKQIQNLSASYGSREYAYLNIQPKFIDTVTREAGALEESDAQVKASGTLGDKPLIVLTAGKSVLGMPVKGKELEELRDVWVNDLQLQLVRLSSRGKRITVPDSDHMIPFERPDAIVNAVREVCAATQLH